MTPREQSSLPACPACRHHNRPVARFCGMCGRALLLPIPAALAPGVLLGSNGRYRIEQLLGQGGFGAAYLAIDRQLERRCVVKQLRHNSAWSPAVWAQVQQNFAREARLLVSLNTPGHPNIPEIYEYLPTSQALVMKYIEGRNLQRLLKGRLDPLPEVDALRYIRAVCGALVYMHSRAPEPVLHRDIKPDNLLLDGEGRVWVIDFGLAKALPVQMGAGDLGRTQAAGTLGYAPPEQWSGAAGPGSDVYALAITLATLLSGQPPGLPLRSTGTPSLPPSGQQNAPVRPALVQLIARATALDVAARPSAREFLAALDALLDEHTTPPPPTPTRVPALLGFVGRRSELALLHERLTNGGAVLLLGMAGVGKTALAATLARQVSEAHPTFWHSFHRGEGFETLLWQLAAFCAAQGQGELWATLHQGKAGGPTRPPATLINYLISTLRGQRYLLCLDDLQLVETEPNIGLLLDELLAVCQSGELGLIVTSRHAPPGVADELCVACGGLSTDEAAELIAASDVAVSAEHAASLTTLTEGNPQLLLLAAAALRRAATPTDLLTRLGAADNVERYLMAEVDSGLSPDEQAAMGALSALLGYGGTHDAVAALLERPNLRRTLFQLRQRSLLTTNESEMGQEYRQHSMVQGFYYQLLGRRERQTLHQRAARYYQHEEPDMLRAARHFFYGDEPALAAALATAHTWMLISRGRARELLELLEQFASSQLDAANWGAVCAARGDCATLLGNGANARANYEAALAALAALPDVPATAERRAHVYHGLGQLLEREAPAEALTVLQRGLAELAGRGLPEEGLLHLRIGSVLIEVGELAEATTALEHSLRLLPATMERWRARTLANLGIVACMQGDLAGGRSFFDQALALYGQAHDYWGVVTVSNNLGNIDDLDGHWPEAERRFQEALELAQQLGSATHAAELELSLGNLQTRMGAFDIALAHLTHALELTHRHNLKIHQLYVQTSLAELRLRLGDREAAQRTLVAAEQLAGELQTRQQLAELARIRAELHLAHGQPGPAYAAANQALAVARELESPVDEGIAMRVLAAVLHATGKYSAAQELLAQSLSVLAEHDPYEAARTQLQQAALQAANGHGDQVESKALLHKARATFERLGARREHATAEALQQEMERRDAAIT